MAKIILCVYISVSHIHLERYHILVVAIDTAFTSYIGYNLCLSTNECIIKTESMAQNRIWNGAQLITMLMLNALHVTVYQNDYCSAL
jgi:hypothetical protein